MDDLDNRCVARRMHGIEDDPWFQSLDAEGQCEAMLIAHLLGLQDAKDIRRAPRRPDREGD